MDPATPQPVLTPLTKSAIFLVYTVRPGGEDQVRDVLGEFTGYVRTVASRAPQGRVTGVVGIGSAAWDRLFAGPRPSKLHPFPPLQGAVHSAPSTPGDLLFHLRADSMDLCFELATVLAGKLAGAVELQDETHGFRYFDARDVIGFVDGTENPGVNEIADSAIVDPAAEPAELAGGSYATVQKYTHDMDAWNGVSVEEQERAIGRHKWDNVEMEDGVKPDNSHSSITTIEDEDGVQRKILRDNMPFGRPGSGEFGTYFISYASDIDVTEEMLRNMFIGRPPGQHDRLLDFSTAHTGGNFFAPSLDFLDGLPPAPGAGDQGTTTAAASARAEEDPGAEPGAEPSGSEAACLPDGCLGIGSLKGQPQRRP
ncbi:Dyp-type peroxidase [Arthrobacter sp. UM1]|uniref:Dyp-type peroxidase n=1 Tax=Arthrobacter sp. UM1 TaxID=2766776 RepID=UPI001CF69E78|nr:Dyp-type peroxidase [Arthrobacter sp. UM1]MCB4208526.1 Dyp-type peroxidase [Arthrobacter sp. UM1]